MAGIYIHIPFCRQACSYCNFHFSTLIKQKPELLAAILEEIRLTEDTGHSIETIYLGGGSPSLLSIDELSCVLELINKKFNTTGNAEITIEANPDDVNRAILQHWIKAGINRVSLGVQSFQEEELKWMNRVHSASESLSSIDEIQQAGFHNFSVDLIFGSPLLSDEDLANNLQVLFDKNVPHISCYALTVEPRTALAKMIEQKRSQVVSSEKQATQFRLLMDAMLRNNYEHYEISNFAKPGMRSKHNSSYWQGKLYYGFGPSAHSFDGKNRRRWNIANNALYVQSIKQNKIPFEEEVLTTEQKLNEYIMTALRTIEGISLPFVNKVFGDDKAGQLKQNIQKYIAAGTVLLQGERLVLTNEGKLFADGIAADLFF